MMVAKGWDVWGNWGYTGQRVQTSSYKMIMFCRSDEQHGDYS